MAISILNSDLCRLLEKFSPVDPQFSIENMQSSIDRYQEGGSRRFYIEFDLCIKCIKQQRKHIILRLNIQLGSMTPPTYYKTEIYYYAYESWNIETYTNYIRELIRPYRVANLNRYRLEINLCNYTNTNSYSCTNFPIEISNEIITLGEPRDYVQYPYHESIITCLESILNAIESENKKALIELGLSKY